MKLHRLITSSLLALPCAALLAFGCSEPETIPGIPQGGNPPSRLSGPPPGQGPGAGPEDAGKAPAGEPGTPGAGGQGAAGQDGGPGDPAAAPQGGEGGDGGPRAVPEGGEAPAEGGAPQGHPCGDGNCDDAEKSDPKLCPRDCSDEEPPGGDWCGDGICDAHESALRDCPKDCGSD